MGINWKQIEEDAVAKVRAVVEDAAAHEPAIEDAVVLALGEAGAPSEVATAVGTALGALLSHFKADKAAPTVVVTPPEAVSPPLAPLPDAPASPAQPEPQHVSAPSPWEVAVSGQNPAS